jgi:hypothetical protein
MRTPENHPEPDGLTALPDTVGTVIQEEKPRPPRSIRWLRLALLFSYLLLPLCLLAGVGPDDIPGSYDFLGAFFSFALPVMLLISLIYLAVWLATRRRYRFGGIWSTTIIILMSCLQLIIVAVVALLLYELSSYNP